MVVLRRTAVLWLVALLLEFDHIHCFQSRHLQITNPLKAEVSRRTTTPRRIQPPAAVFSVVLLWAVGDDEQEDGGGGYDDDATQTKRRRKKNKYDQFSKVSQDDIDPLDAMIAESKQKVEALQQEILDNNKSKWKRVKEEIANSILQENNIRLNSNNNNINNKLIFPDTKEIDPYDPTTFGYIEIGHVTGAHGVRGWIKVESTTAFSQERLCTAGIRHLKPAKKRAPRQVVLLQGKHRLHDEYLLQLQDVDDRNTAMSLRGSVLYAREEDSHNNNAILSTSDNNNDTSTNSIESDGNAEMEEEYFIADLVGLDVYLEDDPTCFVGKVGGVVLGEEMCSIPGINLHDMLEIILQKGPVPSFIRDELVLIPFVPDIVPRVNVREECIFIQPPAGLLNLTYVRQEKVRIKAFLPPGK